MRLERRQKMRKRHFDFKTLKAGFELPVSMALGNSLMFHFVQEL